MIDFAVIGSGISGATISDKLNKKYSVKVFEKAKGVGGRSSFKRFKDKIGFDQLNEGFDKLDSGKVVRQILVP